LSAEQFREPALERADLPALAVRERAGVLGVGAQGRDGDARVEPDRAAACSARCSIPARSSGWL
jgi:hypothetical protein